MDIANKPPSLPGQRFVTNEALIIIPLTRSATTPYVLVFAFMSFPLAVRVFH